MQGRIKKFLHLSGEEKKRFIEAYCLLGIMRMAILTVPFKKLTRNLTQASSRDTLPVLDAKQKQTALLIGKVIEQAAGHTPWESACLVQALCAQKMLERRGIPGVFYLGVAKEKGGNVSMKAHAWTVCDGLIVTGSHGHEAFTVVSVFEWECEAEA